MEKMWYYVANGKDKAGPVPESELRSLIQQGQVQPTELVWCEGMANWQPANQVAGLIGMATAPAAAPAPAAGAPIGGAYTTQQPGYGAGGVPEGLVGWTKFIGIISIIQGVLQCLGCITIPLGVLMIIAGNAALKSCKSLEHMATIDAVTAEYLQNIKKFMLMWGIVAIISIVLMIILVPIYFAMALQFAEEMQGIGVP